MARDERGDRDGEGTKQSLVPESIRKALVTGISALFMTEEGIRNMVSDMRLPKDAMGYLVQQTERTRKELFRVVSDELKGVLKKTDLTRELRRALQGMKVQVRAEIRFVDEKAEVSGADVSVQSKARGPKARPERPTRKKKTRR